MLAWPLPLARVFASPPSEGAWAGLLDALEPKEASLSEAHWQALEEHLAMWPDPLRRAPKRWKLCLLHKLPLPLSWRLIRTLSLRGECLLASTAKAFFASPALSLITHLDLEGSYLESDGASVLASCPFLQNLVSLRLAGAQIGPEGAAALAASSNLSRLSFLDLDRNGIGDDGLEALASSPFLTRLEGLRLGGGAIQNDGITALAASSNAQHLRSLYLGFNEIEENGASAFASSPFLSSLDFLLLDRNPLGLRGIRALASSSGLRGLRSLHLAWNDLPDAAAITLAGSSSFPHLQKLVLDGNKIGNQGALALAKSPALRHLTEIRLSSNPIQASGWKALLMSPFLVGVKERDFFAGAPALSSQATALFNQRQAIRAAADDNLPRTLSFQKGEGREWIFEPSPPAAQSLFQHDLTDGSSWRLLALAAAWRSGQRPPLEVFFDEAKRWSKDVDSVGWAWFLSQIASLRGEELRVAAAIFPSLPLVQEKLREEEARLTPLEDLLFR